MAAGGLPPTAGCEAVGRAVARAAGGGARWVAVAVAGSPAADGAALAAAHGVYLMLARPEPDDAGHPSEATIWSPAGARLLHQVAAVSGGDADPGILDIDGWPCGVLLGDDIRAPELGRLLQLRGALCLWCASPRPRGPGGFAALAGVWSLVQQTQCFALEAASAPGLSAIHAPCEITPGETGFLAACGGAAGPGDGCAGAADGSADARDGCAGAGDGCAGAGDGSTGAGDSSAGAGGSSAGAGDGCAGAGDRSRGPAQRAAGPGTGHAGPGTGDAGPGSGDAGPGAGHAGPGTGYAGPGSASAAAGVIRHPLGEAIRPGSAIPGLAAARLDSAALAGLRASYDLRRYLNPGFYRRHLPDALREPGP